MQSSLYVSLSGQLAAEKRLTSVANNVANMSTSGFRAEEVRFEEVLSNAGQNGVSFAAAGDTFLSTKAGALVQTNGDLDVAVQGDAYFSIMTPAGAAYSRDGRFQVAPGGRLQTIAGHDVLDAGGSPVDVGNDGGKLSIGRDGAITQNNIQLATIGIFELPAGSNLTRYGNSAMLSDTPGVAVQDFTNRGVLQGFTESSNVNPMLELTKLIALQRQFESSMAASKQVEDTAMSSIRSLGPAS